MKHVINIGEACEEDAVELAVAMYRLACAEPVEDLMRALAEIGIQRRKVDACRQVSGVVGHVGSVSTVSLNSNTPYWAAAAMRYAASPKKTPCSKQTNLSQKRPQAKGLQL